MRLKVCICVLVWVCLGKFYNISSQRYLVYVYMWVCVCVPGSVCAWEHAIAGHSEHSHIQAIIISPPAIITTSDSPLLTKLISPSFPSAHPPCSNLSPSAITTLTNAFFWHLRSSTFFFFCSPFSSVSYNARKSQFSTPFYSFIPPKRLLCLTEMCLHWVSNVCWTYASPTKTNGEGKEREKEKAEIERKNGKEAAIVWKPIGCIHFAETHLHIISILKRKTKT